MAGVDTLIARLTLSGLTGQLWVDGSFLTVAVDPRDADVLLHLDGRLVGSLTVQQRAALAWVQSNLRPSLMVDSYVFVETSDPRGDWLRSYWIRQFGFSRQNQPKGIAVVTL